MEYNYLFNKLEEVNKIPYPKVNVERKNIMLANIILDNYSGNVSELSAVLKYVYQKINLKDTDLAKIIGKISIVEMHHLEILGKIINQLGIKSCYISSNNHIFWNASNVCYEVDNICYMLKNNIAQEQDAIAGYRGLICKTYDNNIIDIIKRIIMDEKVHKEIFEYILNNYNKKYI